MKDINEILNCVGNFNLSISKQEIALVGILTKCDTNIILRCASDNKALCTAKLNIPFQVFGIAGGKKLTLLDCHIKSTTGYYGSEQTLYVIEPSEIIIGRYSNEEIKVTSISSTMKELNRMFGETFQINYAFSRENPTVLEYKFPEEIMAKENEGQLFIHHSFEASRSFDKAKFLAKPYIEFKFKYPTEIHKAVQKIACVRNLLSFFADSYLPLGDLSFSDSQSRTEEGENYCALYLNYIDEGEPQDGPFFINDDALQNNFQTIWYEWLMFNEESKHIVSLFYEVISDHSRRINRFLNLCQCLEVYSKRYRNADAQETRNKYPADKHKQKVVRLRDRLEDLFLFVNQFLCLPAYKINGLAQTISNARNFFTHYDPKLSEPTFDCMAAASIFLHFVLLLIVYHRLGIEDKYIMGCKDRIPYKSMDKIIEEIK